MKPVIVLPRLKRPDYAAHRALDPTLPARFEHWQRDAEKIVRTVRRQAQVAPAQVFIDAAPLAEWCAEQGRAVDDKARSEYAIHVYQQR